MCNKEWLRGIFDDLANRLIRDFPRPVAVSVWTEEDIIAVIGEDNAEDALLVIEELNKCKHEPAGITADIILSVYTRLGGTCPRQ